jgi:hypothetical protein
MFCEGQGKNWTIYTKSHGYIKENTTSGVIKISNNDVVVRDCIKGHVVINGPVQLVSEKNRVNDLA